MVAPDTRMWGIILAMSLAPLLTGLIVRSVASRYEEKKYPRTTELSA